MKEPKRQKEYKSWRTFVSDYKCWTPMIETACKIAERQGYRKALKEFKKLTTNPKNHE